MEPLLTQKECLCCQKIKPMAEYGYHKTNKKFKNTCKQCNNKKAAEYRKLNRKKYLLSQSNSKLKQNYGISMVEYEQKLIEQQHACAICFSTTPGQNNIKRFSVDHCHKTGKIRGLLCSNCNKGIGLLNDSVELLEAAIEYLKLHSNVEAS
jgi:hypothetical protein